MKKLATILVLAMCLLMVFAIPASAAYVTDGNALYTAGDTNGDNEVNICDLVGAYVGSGSSAAADLDGDGSLGAYDYALIRAMILGIDNSQWTEQEADQNE